MELSSDFHDSKESSDIHQAVFQGRSVTSLVDLFCFQILPMFIDLAAAIAYLYFLFGPYMGLLIATIVVSYLYVTTRMVSMVSMIRRRCIKHYRHEWLTGYSSLNNWQIASVRAFIKLNSELRMLSKISISTTYRMSNNAIPPVRSLCQEANFG